MVKEALRKAINHELAHARGHLVTISIRKLSIWHPELREFPLTVRTKALKELIQQEYAEYFIMEWNGARANSDKRYILVRDKREREKVLKSLNSL
jgi:hypothetical protein